MPTKRTIEVVRSTYQPSKAEKEEKFNWTPKPGITPEKLAKTLLQPVKIHLIEKPKSSRI